MVLRSGRGEPRDGSRFDAVVVGGGPRAVALLERLTARLRRDGGAARVAVVDAVEVGGGATWRTDQTRWFLNNTTSAATTIFPDAAHGVDDVPEDGETLVEWASRVVAERGARRAAWVLEEAEGVAPASFPSRRLQGAYYREQLARIEARGGIALERIVGLVVDVDERPDGATVVLASGRRLESASVVLAQGMLQSHPDAEVRALTDAAERLGLVHVPPGMPSERDWSVLPAGEDVLVRGLGASFFDVAAELTAGRGGRFEPVPGDPLGRLRYLPSGREPRIHALSRRGIPYRTKGDLTHERPAPFVARFATPAWFAALGERSPGSIDLARRVWPAIAADLALAGVAAIEARHPGAVPAGLDELADALRALPLPHPADPAPRDAAVRAVDAVVAARLVAPHRLRLDELRRPTGGQPVGEDGWAATVAALVEDELDSAAHPASSPRQAVNLAMAALRGPAAALAALGVVEGASRVRDVHGWFDADGLFLASGPPAVRTRQVLALVEAGVVRLVGPEAEVVVDEAAGAFVARSPISGIEVRARALAEARMSKGAVPGTDDPLLQALLGTGRARLHVLRTASGGSVASTSLDVVPPTADASPLALVDGAGEPWSRVLVLGIPALSTQPGSAIGASPGVWSPLLAWADLAAARVLAIAGMAAAPLPVLD